MVLAVATHHLDVDLNYKFEDEKSVLLDAAKFVVLAHQPNF